MESTPFDVEVAVDPEMLGKVFEELVTGRHESGSYYTPRPVVSFMCREALKGYLETQSTGASAEAIAAFVEQKDTSQLTLSSAPKVGEALARVKVVDPACGSGAYLLGMMQELVELMTALYSAQLSHQAQDLYNLKLRIIEQNLYGADIDQFAVNIAMLRLWLSLAIEYDGKVEKLPPLPNLDFKIVRGDSLLGPDPSPENFGDLFRHRVHQLAGQLADLKARHMRATGQEKTNLTKEIEGLKTQLREALADAAAPAGAVDWRVEFAEVFDQNGGFDIAIANPPYVRQEDIGENKARLRELFAEAVTGQSDLYCYFYARAVQLLRADGMHVFVCSNSWLDVEYGTRLQEFLLRKTWVKSIFDSAVERQFSTAAINTIISMVHKGETDHESVTRFVSLRAPFGTALANPALRRERVLSKKELLEAGSELTGSGRGLKYVGDKWGGKYLRAPDIYHSILAKARGKLVRLSDVAELRRGFTSGANEFFYLDKAAVEKWEIEDEFLRPLIKSPRECRRVIVDSGDVEQHVFVCHKTKRELHGSNALAYINWGEQVPVLVKQGAKKGREVTGFHSLETVKNRHCWYDLGNRDYPNLVWTKSVDASHRQALILFEAFVDQRLYEISSPTPYLLAAVLNSFVTMLFKELEGRVNMGDGVLDTAVYEAQRILIVNPAYLAGEEGALRHLLEELAKRPIAPVWEEAATGDRKGLDEAVFDVLGLSLGDREAVYEAVTSLVHGRLDKAQSILS